MTPFTPARGADHALWFRRGMKPGWLTLAAGVAFVAVGALADEIASVACRAADACADQPAGNVAFGLLVAVFVAAFVCRAASAPLAVAFLLSWVFAQVTELEYPWWVDVSAVAFVVVAVLVNRAPRAAALQLSAEAAAGRKRVPARALPTLVRPWWLVGFGLSALVTVGSLAAFLLRLPDDQAGRWLLVTGVGGGLAVVFGWRATDWALARRRFMRTEQAVHHCTVLPLRFEILVVPERLDDPALVVPSSVWEEARLEQIWAPDAGPDGCSALLYGTSEPGRWAAVEVAGELIVAREPTWAEPREDALRAAVEMLRHLANALPTPAVADSMRRTADRYAADVDRADNTMPGI